MNVFTQHTLIVGRLGPQGAIPLGTAFIIQGKPALIVTPKHNIGDDPTGLFVIAPHIADLNTFQDVEVGQFQPIFVKVIESDPVRDIALLEVPGEASGVVPLADLDSVQVGEDVELYGFPHCTQGRRALTYQKTTIGSKVLLDTSGLKTKHAVLNIQSRPGQSGSPVYSPRIRQVVGILIGSYSLPGGVIIGGINPQELNQTTQVLCASYIRSML